MGLVGVAGFAVLTSPNAAYRMVVSEIYSTFSSYTLSVIPMFVWMGFLAYYSGIGTGLYDLAYKLMGHLPGGSGHRYSRDLRVIRGDLRFQYRNCGHHRSDCPSGDAEV